MARDDHSNRQKQKSYFWSCLVNTLTAAPFSESSKFDLEKKWIDDLRGDVWAQPKCRQTSLIGFILSKIKRRLRKYTLFWSKRTTKWRKIAFFEDISKKCSTTNIFVVRKLVVVDQVSKDIWKRKLWKYNAIWCILSMQMR